MQLPNNGKAIIQDKKRATELSPIAMALSPSLCDDEVRGPLHEWGGVLVGGPSRLAKCGAAQQAHRLARELSSSGAACDALESINFISSFFR